MDIHWASKLAAELKNPLPGAGAQLRMAPSARLPLIAGKSPKKSGVLLLLYPCDDDIYTVFIKRTEYVGIHSGQISFPGGKFEKHDVTLANTALREAVEETGIPVDAAKIIGNLTPLTIPVSNTIVFPYVAICHDRPVFHHDPGEVQYLIEARIDDLLNPVNHRTKIMRIAGYKVSVPYIDIQNNHIWGATAMILSEFLEVVKKVMSDE